MLTILLYFGEFEARQPNPMDSITNIHFSGATKDSLSLSFEFYQVMVGDTRMSVHGWKQLAQWSIQHSCLSDAEGMRAMAIFERDWGDFCDWVVATYGEYADGLPDLA